MTGALHGLGFAALFDAVADAMLLVDAAGCIERANPAAQQMFGYGAHELSGMMVEALIPPDYREPHIQHRQQYIERPARRPMGNGKNLLALRRDGAQLPVDIGLSPIEIQGKLFILVIFHRIDKQVLAETSLKAQKVELQNMRARYRVLIEEALSDALLVHDHDGHIIEANPQATSMLGYAQDELQAMSIADIEVDADLSRMQAEWEKITPGSPMIMKRHYRRKDSSVLPVEVHLGLQASDTQRIYVVFARDISERERDEASRKELHAEMEQLTHYQVAVQTASAIAHELNQPFAAISAYSEVALHALEADEPGSERLKRALEGCAAQAQRAGRSLHELIDFLQEGEFTAEAVDLNTLVRLALSGARTNGFSKFHSQLDLETDMPPACASRVHVQKVLSNLINNSIEAMRDAGTDVASIVIRIRTMSDQHMAKVTVQDTGPGIDDETVKSLFEPFFSTKPKGVGMGLIISRALIEANGGQLWFDPEDKPGAAFHFTLPLAHSS